MLNTVHVFTIYTLTIKTVIHSTNSSDTNQSQAELDLENKLLIILPMFFSKITIKTY